MAQPEVKFGRYHVLSRLASGGMAEVWLGEFRGHGGFAKRVVLKTMRPELARHDELVQMFIAEASIAARLDHDNIVTVYDFGEHEGVFFIAMEHVSGRTLRQIARCPNRDRAADLWFLCRTTIEACAALKYVHDFDDGGDKPLGLVHRDVSPENVMVSFTGAVKLLDFGIVAANKNPTQTDMLLGKCRYMAPERLTNPSGIPASDIFSLGVLLYEMSTGVSPFSADSDAAVLHRVAEYDPPPPSSIAPHLPELFDELVMKSLSKDLTKRYKSADELADDLREFLRAWDSSSLTRNIDRYMAQLFPNAPELPKYLRAPVVPAAAPVVPEVQIQVMIDAVLEPGTELPESTIVEGSPAATQDSLEPLLATPSVLAATIAPTLELPALQRDPLDEALAAAELEPIPMPPPLPMRSPLAEFTPAPLPSEFTPAPLRVETTPLPDIFRRATQLPVTSFTATDLFSRTPEAPVVATQVPPPAIRDVFGVTQRISAPTSTPIFGTVAAPQREQPPPQAKPPPPQSEIASTKTSTASSKNTGTPARSDPFATTTRATPAAEPRDFFATARRDANLASEVQPNLPKEPTAQESRRASQLFERGFQHYQNKSYHAALEAWREALALDPTNRSYQSNLKRLEQQLEKLKNKQ